MPKINKFIDLANKHKDYPNILMGFSSPFLDAIREARKYGQIDLAKKLLTDPFMAKNFKPMSYACEWGYKDVVEKLIADGHQPEERDVNTAIQKKHVEVVEFLFRGNRFDPNAFRHEFSVAVCEGRKEIVQYFLKDRRFDPTFNECKNLYVAYIKERRDILDLFIENGYANLPWFSYFTIQGRVMLAFYRMQYAFSNLTRSIF